MDTHTLNLESDYTENASYRRHQKQFFWQILIPVGLGFALFLAVAVMVVMATPGVDAGESASRWADASTIWLVMPVLVLAIFAALVLFSLVYLFAKVLKVLPGYTFLIQQYTTMISTKIQNWSNKSIAPVIAVKSAKARVSAFFSMVFGRSER